MSDRIFEEFVLPDGTVAAIIDGTIESGFTVICFEKEEPHTPPRSIYSSGGLQQKGTECAAHSYEEARDIAEVYRRKVIEDRNAPSAVL